jgi:hypothetical protein
MQDEGRATTHDTYNSQSNSSEVSSMHAITLICTIWIDTNVVFIGNELETSAEYARLYQTETAGEITMSCQKK